MRARLMKQVYTELVHAVWMERNTRVFEQVERPINVIEKEIACACNVRASLGTRVLLQQFKF